ncbi:MOSC domain-containing protein [Baekduia sp.]|jgi:MOSC domain-containing protein YiiM|uniref:MOSC domain-containing protein n=1 Tax=Baekduia sp. TaxID=2600305 RepID=UPI002DF843F4|nr:MOSC domain-containing protein [Baekduia sp.]
MTAARVVSLQVARASTLPWRGKEVPSGFLKAPVDGRLALGPLGLDGDEQADLTVHGGPDKAICCYASEHFPFWTELTGRRFGPGAFGENLTLAGLTEQDVHIGDTYTLGDDGAVVQVSQPRGPCFKVAARWGVRTLPKEMAHRLIAGFYLRMIEPGTVAAGDMMTLIERGSDITVAEVLRVTYRDRHDPPALSRVMDVATLADQWRAALTSLAAHNMLPLTDPVGDA